MADNTDDQKKTDDAKSGGGTENTGETATSESSTEAEATAASNSDTGSNAERTTGQDPADPALEDAQAGPGQDEAEQTEGEQVGLTSDQSFTYWVIMLPFIIWAGVFIFDFSKAPGDYVKLINAAGVIVVGIFVASFVNALTQGNEPKEENGHSATSS